MGQRVGLIGLGNLGSAIAGHLLEVGYSLTVYNRTASKTEGLRMQGAEVAPSPRALAESCEQVITVVAGDGALEAVMLGGDGALAAAGPIRMVIDLSTIGPSTSARLARAAEATGVTLIRAPVSGSITLAARGALTIMVSGDEAAYRECRRLLEAVGSRVIYLGSGEESRYMKLVLNLMVGVTAQAMAEALALGRKAGLDWRGMMEVIGSSAVSSPLVKYKQDPLTERDFRPSFTVRLMEKDFDLILATARELKVPLAMAALVRHLYAAAAATGRAEQDYFSLVLLEEELAGLDVSGPNRLIPKEGEA